MPEHRKHEVMLDFLYRINKAAQSGAFANPDTYCPHCRCYRFDPMLSRVEAWAYTGFMPSTLAVWDSTKKYDLQPIKFANAVRYRVSSLNNFADQRQRP